MRASDTAFDNSAHWLGATRLIDLADSKLRLRAISITQLANSDVQKAILIHDYIKSLPFGCAAAFEHLPAGAVLKSGRGDCHTKGTLFVAMLRCVGLPARLRFVTLSGAFLHGIIDLGQSTITQAVGEVYLRGRWVQTDTYVTDSLLEAQAYVLLSQKNRSTGYGIHLQGNRFWDGQQHAHGQYAESDPASMPLHDWGVAHDPEGFYSSQNHPQLKMGWLARTKWMIAARVVNSRVKKVRSAL